MSSTDKKPEFRPIPKSDYLVRMTDVDESETRNGKGTMVKATFQVVNGDHKNRLIFESFLVEHENEKAQEIGQKRLNTFLKAVGVKNGMDDLGNDRSQLQNYLELPLIASVDIKEPEEYKDRTTGESRTSKAKNFIKVYKAR